MEPSQHRKWVASFKPGYGCLYLSNHRYSHKHPDVWGMFRGLDNVVYKVGGWHQYRYGKPQVRIVVQEADKDEQIEWDGREHEWEDSKT